MILITLTILLSLLMWEHKYGMTSAMNLKLLSYNIYKSWFTVKYIYIYIYVCVKKQTKICLVATCSFYPWLNQLDPTSLYKSFSKQNQKGENTEVFRTHYHFNIALFHGSTLWLTFRVGEIFEKWCITYLFPQATCEILL